MKTGKGLPVENHTAAFMSIHARIQEGLKHGSDLSGFQGRELRDTLEAESTGFFSLGKKRSLPST